MGWDGYSVVRDYGDDPGARKEMQMRIRIVLDDVFYYRNHMTHPHHDSTANLRGSVLGNCANGPVHAN
jgi:hypothetical protein